MERPQPLVRKCVWERAQSPAFKQRRISSLPLLPSPASPVYLPPTPSATREVVEAVRSHPYFPVRSVGAPTVLHPDGISAREAEDQERERLARVWVGCARLVAESSSTLSKLRWDDGGCLLPLFVKSAPNTLRRHLSGWRVWASFCATLQWRAGAPSLQQLLDFVQGLQNGIRDDRGKNRKRSAMGVLNGMNYAAQVLSLSVLQEHLATPLLKNLRIGDEWSKPQETEATPLPLCVVRNLEAALLENEEDTLFLAALLLMLWAGLRFSDIQRIDLSTVAAVDNSIRGFCWRTKSQKRVLGMSKVWNFGERLGKGSSGRSIKSFSVLHQARLFLASLQEANVLYHSPGQLSPVYCGTWWFGGGASPSVFLAFLKSHRALLGQPIGSG